MVGRVERKSCYSVKGQVHFEELMEMDEHTTRNYGGKRIKVAELTGFEASCKHLNR